MDFHDTNLDDDEAEALRAFAANFHPVKPGAPLSLSFVKIEWVDWVRGNYGKITAAPRSYTGPATVKGKWIHFILPGGKATKKALDGNHITTTPTLQWSVDNLRYEP